MSMLEELKKELARRSYVDYVEYVHEGKWLRGKHLEHICNDIELLINDELYNEKGENVQTLVLEVPPQHGKSQSVTETLPSYYLGKFPTRRVIEVSYGDDLARKFGRRNKQKIIQFGKELFNIELSKSSSSDTEFELQDYKGSMISRGIMSGITGQAADLIIIDDPIKNRQEADSETYRSRMKEEFLNSILTRLSANGKVVIIQTRWHEDDLAGWVKDNFNRVKTITFPCEAEEDDLLGRKKGDSLFPEIGKDNKWLKEFKHSYTTQEGSRAWNALFQQKPTSTEGNMIKREWLKYYQDLPSPKVDKQGNIIDRYAGMMYILISVDATFKNTSTSDYVSIQVWGKRNADMYLLDRDKKRMSFTDTIIALRKMVNKFRNYGMILIEDKANGSAIIDTLQRSISGIIPVNPEGGKESRLSAITPCFESGNVYLPQNAIWINDYVNELVSFPNGKHDDDVDSTSQALVKLRYITAEVPVHKSKDDFFDFEDNNKEDMFNIDITDSFLNY